MKITKVTVEHYDRGIPLKGWDSVKTALNLYARGIVKGSKAAENEQMRAIGQSYGALGLGLYLVSAQYLHGSRFVEHMTDEAHEFLQECERWSGNYDYDGQGAFFKTTVGISVLDRKEELYMLQINAAYVGSEPEASLAEVLGIPQALRQYTVTAEVKPEDALHFAFDFEEILRALDGVLKTDSLKGEEIASRFMTSNHSDEAIKPAQIYFGTEICVTVAPGHVRKRFVYDKPGEPQDTWTVEGSVLHGQLYSSYRGESEGQTPTIVLTISSIQDDRFGYGYPVWNVELKDQIRSLSNQIAKALKKI